MCHQSVGLIQRALESSGLVTISITLAKEITRKVSPPRALYPGFPLGHPIAHPNQPSRQLQVLRLLLKHGREIRVPGTIVELDLTREKNTVGAGVGLDL